MKNLKAFTLAEVLIVLGIIGVISAMTLPTLISNYQKQVLVNQLRKSHSLLSQAFERMMQEEKAVNFNETDFWSVCRNGNSNTQCQNVLNKYIKTTSTEYLTSSRSYNGLSCSYSSGKYSNCSKSGISAQTHYVSGIAVTLPDGANLYINASVLTVDVNGSQKPNTFGRDIFVFWVNSNTGELEPHFSNGLLNQIITDGWEMNY